MKIAVLGVRGSGKTRLAQALANVLSTESQSALCIPDARSEGCSHHGRSPSRHELAEWARDQMLRVRKAASTAVLVADSTALLTAVECDLLLGDASLYRPALEQQRSFDLNLLTGLELPVERRSRSAAHQPPADAVDTRLRQVLDEHGLTYAVVYGSEAQRIASALQALTHHRGSAASPPGSRQRWHGYCERCGDPGCEHRLFTRPPGSGLPASTS